MYSHSSTRRANLQIYYMIIEEKIGVSPLELKRAATFFANQIKKGWTCQEAAEQVKNSYGYKVYFNVLNSFRRVLNK